MAPPGAEVARPAAAGLRWRMLRRATASIVVGILLGTAPIAGRLAVAQNAPGDEPEDEPAEADAPEPAQRRGPAAPTKREGDYSGVSPGEPAASAAKKVKAGASTLTWVGFAAQDSGGAQIFFQGTSRFSASQRLEGTTLVVDIEGLRRMATNTRRPLDTRFFESSVARVTAKAVRARKKTRKAPARKAGIEVRITFKSPADAREGNLRQETAPDGTFVIYLDLGTGKS
jgi:hypothetical protein